MGDLQAKTVVIVGAGASREFDLPVGEGLMEKISEELSDVIDPSSFRIDPPILSDAFRECENAGIHSLNGLSEASQKIVSGLPFAQSIDNFLHNNKADAAIVLAGKIAIASIIIQEEQESTLYQGPVVTAPKQLQEGVKESDSWLHRYFKVLVSNKSFEEFIQGLKNTTFVSFNYDRCIQQFFWNASNSYFTTVKDASVQTIKALEIIYPYGNVGEFVFNHYQTSFGNNGSPQNILEAAKSLKTFTEGEDQGIRASIHEKIDAADNILVLGFGYIPINMELLFSGKKFGGKVILCTAYGLSLPDISSIKTKFLETFFWNNISYANEMHVPDKTFVQLEKITATKLFYQYSQYLSQPKFSHHGTLLKPK